MLIMEDQEDAVMDTPYIISEKEEVGRCLIASRNIEPLEVILTDVPAAIGPHHDSLPVCLECLRLHDGDFRCDGCGYPMCNETCSLGPIHSQECGLLAQLDSIYTDPDYATRTVKDQDKNYMIMLALRLLMVKQDKPDLWDEIDKLMDHEEERRNNTEEWTMFQKDVVFPLAQILPDVEESVISRIIGIININSVGIDVKNDNRRGRSLYPLLSIVSHSCVSNARYTVNSADFSVTLRARTRIKKGEEITISYIPSIYGMPKRKKLITDEWYFTCRCPRCQDVTEFGTYTSALKCTSCFQGLVLPDSIDSDSIWRCRECLNPFEAEFVSDFVQNIEDELYSIKNNPSPKNYENFLKKHAKELHIRHYLNLIAQRNLIHLLGLESKPTREMLKTIVKYSKTFIFAMSRVDPGYSEWRGTIQKRLNRAQLALLQIDLQEKKLDKTTFVEQSSDVWSKMKEVENCELLCTPFPTSKPVVLAETITVSK